MEKKVDARGRVISEEISYSGIRKMIGTRMRNSLDSSPQASMSARADMSKVVELRKKLAEEGLKVTYTDIFIKIVGCVVKELPIINSTRDDKVITIYETVNAGIATKVGSELVVPVIFDVCNKSLREIAIETKEIIENAREGNYGKIPLEGATITVNNLGMYDIDVCTPIINAPESTILALGAIRNEAWVDEDMSIVVKPIATLSLTNDHSIYDGSQVAECLCILKKIMKDPQKYILEQ